MAWVDVMSRRLIRASVLAALTSTSVVGWSASASAGVGDSNTTSASASADQDTGKLAATAGRETTGGRSAAGASQSRARCTWEKYTDLQVALDQSGPVTPIVRDGASGTILPSGSPSSQTTETLYKRVCDGAAGFTLAWVPDFVDVDALVASARQQVTAQVPRPEMNMNPDPSVGGTVNIGLWLAVADPGQVSITASVGPVWATVTARYEGTTWDFGNGDSTTCDGLGTPIVDKETAEEGPCGYTYRWPSAPKFTGTDDLAYHASVTGHWVVTYATSQGTGGSLGPIDRTTSFNYQVREIQTVRVAGNG
jgi:hypothetical protein